MKLFPDLRKSIQSPLTPMALCQLLSSKILPASHVYMHHTGTVYLVGRVTPERFWLVRKQKHTGMAGEFPPIQGRIIPTDSGSEIQVTISPHPSLNLIYMFGIIGLSIIILICLFGTKAYSAAIGPGLILLYLFVTLPYFRSAARRDNEIAFQYFTELIQSA